MDCEIIEIIKTEPEKPCKNCEWPMIPGDEIYVLKNPKTGEILSSEYCCKPCAEKALESLKPNKTS